jgi:uncharacterized protein GlcG (DUF336 family)
MQLTSEQAGGVIAAAKARATDIGITVSVAVLDSAGHLKAFARMDGAWLGSVDVALRKARTSVLFEAETQAIGEVCKAGAQAEGLQFTNEGLITFAGGIPLKAANGELLGAIGISGGQVAQDFAIASAGASALRA